MEGFETPKRRREVSKIDLLLMINAASFAIIAFWLGRLDGKLETLIDVFTEEVEEPPEARDE